MGFNSAFTGLRTFSFILRNPLSSDVQCNISCIDNYILYIIVRSIQRIGLHSICSIIKCYINKLFLNSIWTGQYDIKEYPLCIWASLPTDTFCRTTHCNLDNGEQNFGRILVVVFRLESWLNKCSLYVGVQFKETCIRSSAYFTGVILIFFFNFLWGIFFYHIKFKETCIRSSAYFTGVILIFF
jgi:hypothetical protein